jgi:predicted alpha/beta superfamily hydrolase
MRSIALCFCLCVSVTIHAQTGNKIILGIADSVYSNILHENRKIWVHVPVEGPDPDGNIFAKQHYPVIYLLDGWEPNFSIVTSMVEQLGGGSGNLAFPQMIVVGIPNTDRTRDLTPIRSYMPMMDSMEASRSGGGENFISFIEKELIPHVDSLYPTSPYRILIGHSLGGLMAVYTLINHSSLFNAYVAIDPSTIWDDKLVLRQAKEALERKQFKNNSFFLAIANTMNSGIDTSIIGLHMRTNFQLRDYLNAYKETNLVFSCKYYPEYDHNSVPIVAEYDALRSIFNFYNFNFPFAEFFNPSYKSDTLLRVHYETISRRMGYKVAPPEQFMNAIAYQLMSMKQFDRAYYFFGSNIENYPESFNAYDSMGDFYDAKGDKEKAVEYYSKSLKLHNSPVTRKKIDKLKLVK